MRLEWDSVRRYFSGFSVARFISPFCVLFEDFIEAGTALVILRVCPLRIVPAFHAVLDGWKGLPVAAVFHDNSARDTMARSFALSR